MGTAAGRLRRILDGEAKAFYQQRLSSCTTTLGPKTCAAVLCGLAAVFLGIGFALRAADQSVVEYSVQYDGPGTASQLRDCAVNGTSSVAVVQVCRPLQDLLPAARPVRTTTVPLRCQRSPHNFAGDTASCRVLACLALR